MSIKYGVAELREISIIFGYFFIGGTGVFLLTYYIVNKCLHGWYVLCLVAFLAWILYPITQPDELIVKGFEEKNE